ncbi:MAG: adenylate/guanylate cyclase domain-containing protein [Hyphomicrobiaceae bacterium]
MPLIPETRYTQSGGVNIAYQVFGDGPVDVVMVPGWFFNVESAWEVTRFARFYRDISAFARVITFDKRGTGMSDRDGQAYVLEDRMDDVRAAMDAANSERAILCGWSEGGPMSLLFAATYPERTQALVIIGGYARKIAAHDCPAGAEATGYSQMIQMMENDFSKAMEVGPRAPSVESDTLFQRQWLRCMRQSASPGTAVKYAQMNGDIDVRAILPSIQAPTLMLHATGDKNVDVRNGRYLAERIPGARIVEIESDDHIVHWTEGAETVVEEIRKLATVDDREAHLDRIVCTVLFTDIVDSTRLAAQMGDQRWGDLISEHHTAVRAALAEHRGREIKTTGDGFLAIFDGPARAVRCAAAINSAVAPLGLTIRAGLHTGECVVRDDDVEGIAVHVAARVSDIAKPGAVAVSQTVRDLVVGSELRFEGFGVHTFKGITDPWHVYELDF